MAETFSDSVSSCLLITLFVCLFFVGKFRAKYIVVCKKNIAYMAFSSLIGFFQY